jgi:hypothetical protein
MVYYYYYYASIIVLVNIFVIVVVAIFLCIEICQQYERINLRIAYNQKNQLLSCSKHIIN